MISPHGLSLADLDFDRIPVECLTPSGGSYRRWMRVGMPKISEQFLDSVFFLYANREDAEARQNPGGTGFVVEMGREVHHAGGGGNFYGVTNWHVAVKKGFSVIRLSARYGSAVLEFGPEDWEFIPGGADVAVVPLSFDESFVNMRRTPSVHLHSFVQRRNYIGRVPDFPGVGEDAFMVGLFIDHHGHSTNVPSARFGNVSMLADDEAMILQPTNYRGESYVLDLHSRTGFSGSPVFVYRTFGSDLTTRTIDVQDLEIEKGYRTRARMEFRSLFSFLGIHWGQFPEKWELRHKDDISEARRDHLITDGTYIEGMSGMTLVVPAWEIVKVLALPRFQEMRNEAHKIRAEQRAMKPRAETRR